MPPPDLAETQRLFHRMVTSARRPAGVDLERLGAIGRLDVYAEMYFARLHDVLADQFPRLAAAVGAEFAALVRRYLAACPPRAASVDDAGDRLAAFLEKAEPDRPRWSELARLERLHVELFGAADAEALELGALAALPPDALAEVELALVPSAALFAGASERLLLRRDGGDVLERAADDLEWRALERVARGVPLVSLADCFGTAARFRDHLVRWTDERILRAPTPKEDPS